MFASSFILLFDKSKQPFSHSLTGGLFLICGLLLLLRSITSIVWDTEPVQLPFVNHPMGSINYLTFYIMSVMLTFGFVLMCNDRYINERDQKEFEKQQADTKLWILSKAIEQSPVTTIITDINGKIEFVNPMFTETTGYTAQEAIGKNSRILKTEYSTVDYKKLWDTILAGKNWHGVFQNKKKNGELILESTVISPVKDKDGTITHFLAVKEDITERKKSEFELKRSNERFLKIFDNNPIGMIMTNIETGKFQNVNQRFLMDLGYTKQEVIGKSPIELDIIAPGSQEKVLFKLKEKDVSADHEVLVRKKSGEWFWTLSSTKEIIINDKKFILTSFQNITDRKNIETILKNKTDLLNDAQHITHIGSWDWDLLENKVTRSDEHYRIYGITRTEVEPDYENFKNYTHPDDREYADTVFQQAFKDCKPFDFFHRIIRPDGTVRILHAKGNVTTNSMGKAIRLVGTRQDVTEIKLAEQELLRNIAERQEAEAIILRKSIELARSNKNLEEFAYIVSHDLKAPLRAIGSLSNFLEEDYSDKLGPNGLELLKLMVGRVDRLNNLIEGILKYSKIGRSQQKTEKVNLNNIVKEVIELIAPPGNIEIKIETFLPTILYDPIKAEQVFQNLIGNSIKYMDKPKGIIRIGSSSEGNFWKFYVADNGPGIGEKYFEKIFQIFQTLSPRDKKESTGIGLSIVKKIIETNGGKIWLESKVGQGSTFYFTIPMS
jgi:PAS domain S-box-containing protein